MNCRFILLPASLPSLSFEKEDDESKGQPEFSFLLGIGAPSPAPEALGVQDVHPCWLPIMFVLGNTFLRVIISGSMVGSSYLKIFSCQVFLRFQFIVSSHVRLNVDNNISNFKKSSHLLNIYYDPDSELGPSHGLSHLSSCELRERCRLCPCSTDEEIGAQRRYQLIRGHVDSEWQRQRDHRIIEQALH